MNTPYAEAAGIVLGTGACEVTESACLPVMRSLHAFSAFACLGWYLALPLSPS